MAAAPIMHDVTPESSAFLPKVTHGTNQVIIPGERGYIYWEGGVERSETGIENELRTGIRLELRMESMKRDINLQRPKSSRQLKIPLSQSPPIMLREAVLLDGFKSCHARIP